MASSAPTEHPGRFVRRPGPGCEGWRGYTDTRVGWAKVFGGDEPARRIEFTAGPFVPLTLANATEGYSPVSPARTFLRSIRAAMSVQRDCPRQSDHVTRIAPPVIRRIPGRRRP